MHHRRHLVIFTRYPSFGTGKRRLAADVGAATALRFQRVNLAHTLRRLGSSQSWKTWLAVTPDRSGPWPRQLGLIGQGNGDFGERLARVAQALPRGTMLILGSDLPGVTRALVSRAFHVLEGNDAVVGPSSDGGYWSIGLRRRPNCINSFKNVRWSTKHAFSDTLANLEGRSVAELVRLDDIDDGDALRRYQQWGRLHACREK